MSAAADKNAIRLYWTAAKRLALVLQLACLLAGGLMQLASKPDVALQIWFLGTFVALAVLMAEVARNALQGNFALDIIAAVAMFAALLLGETLAGIVVATMYLGGQLLEDLASRRVGREMKALLEKAPRFANRFAIGQIETVDVSAVKPGDRLLVRRGEIVAVDGTLLSSMAILDQASLTGEAMPVKLERDGLLLSGTTNAGDAFEMLATRTSAESTYSGIVKLVEDAQSSKSPTMRLADRYAVWFLVITAIASAAAWLISGDAVRALAVLVVATPCPLLLAVPIAILSGVSRCAGRGILVKGGGALEALAQADTLLLDKTGTITDGRAILVDIKTFDGFDPAVLLSLAASLDQGSHHVTAEAIASAAKERGLLLKSPEGLQEEPGCGIRGQVEGKQLCLGKADFIRSQGGEPERLGQLESLARNKGGEVVCVMIGDRVAGGLVMADHIRVEAPTVLRRIRDAGIRRIVLVTGDHADHAKSVVATLGLDDFKYDLKPQDKIAAVEVEKAIGRVIMVGDGVNDAPALAAADVGVAMGARGAAASSEAADIVLLVDRFDRLVTARHISGRSMTIARQSAIVGIVLSAMAMVLAMAGYLSPIAGALLQEAIDVAVIVNALRSLGQPVWLGGRRRSLSVEELCRLESEHRKIAEVIDQTASLADSIQDIEGCELRRRLQLLDTSLDHQLLQHEKNDEDELFPRLRGAPGRETMFTGLSRTHMEIRRRLHAFSALVQSLPTDPGTTERRDIQRLLDGLVAIAKLHFEEEEEVYRLLEAG